MRRVAAECIQEEQEWILATCYSRANRLITAGISNKHAGVKGMPKLDPEESSLIMKTLMALKGKAAKKHQEAQAKGRLRVKRSPLNYAKIMDPMEDLVGKLETRTNASAAAFQHEVHEPKMLRKVFCPNCLNEKSTKSLRLKSKSQFSNIKCTACKEVSSAKGWSCECGVCWKKCGAHILFESRPKQTVSTNIKRKRRNVRGSDVPFPKVRRKNSAGESVSPFLHVSTARMCIALPPGGALASRFPHLVKREASDQRGAPG